MNGWRRERLFAALRRELRRFLVLFLVAAGAACGLATLLFHDTLELTREFLSDRAVALPPGPARWLAVALLPAAGAALLAVLVPRFSPHAGGGLSLVRAAYGRDPRRLDLRALLGTFLATPLSLGSGAPLGPEGPTVVLTSGVAIGLARLVGLPARFVRGMIPVGTAAGIAAIFNTPITGVVFALEEVIGTASRGVLGGAIVAAVAAAVVQKSALGGRHLLPATPAAWHEAHELVGFAVLGLVAGAFAGLIPRIVPKLRRLLRRATARCGRAEAVARAALAGLAVGLLGLLSPEVLGYGYGPISDWLAGRGNATTALLAFGAKVLAMSIALAAPLVGGVFAPSLFLGASLGAATGHLLHDLTPLTVLDPAAYALVGMGAFFAGFLRTPIASVLIVFELTGNYDLVLPQMLAVALASLAARRISPSTLVEQQLEEEGVAGLESAGDPLASQRVRDAMTTDVLAFRAETSLREAWPQAEARGHPQFPVLDGDGICVGLISLADIAAAALEGRLDDTVQPHARPARLLATPDETLDRVSLRLGAAGETRCPVVESLHRPRLVGFLSATDLLRARVRASLQDTDTRFDPL